MGLTQAAESARNSRHRAVLFEFVLHLVPEREDAGRGKQGGFGRVVGGAQVLSARLDP